MKREEMTEEQAIALGQRAVALGWTWFPGALDLSGRRCVAVDGGVRLYAVPVEGQHWPAGGVTAQGAPDLRDRATRGLLPDLVREVLHDPTLYAEPWIDEDRSGWNVYSAKTGGALGAAESEVEAWIDAWGTAK